MVCKILSDYALIEWITIACAQQSRHLPESFSTRVSRRDACSRKSLGYCIKQIDISFGHGYRCVL